MTDMEVNVTFLSSYGKHHANDGLNEDHWPLHGAASDSLF